MNGGEAQGCALFVDKRCEFESRRHRQISKKKEKNYVWK